MINFALFSLGDLVQQTDESLALLSQQGHQDAFSTLYERLFGTVFKRVRYSVPERDVEDVTQEVFISVMRSLKNYRGDAKFRTWLRTLVTRQIADYYRRRKSVEPDLEISEELEEDDPSYHTHQVRLAMPEKGDLDDQIIIRQCMRQLPDHYREIILLRFVEGLPFNEISEVQNMNLEATKSQFRRAIAAMQKILEESGYDG